jgi:hypothetical protein
VQFDRSYWNVIAKSIDVEDEKIGLFVSHNPSRGIAREAIFRSLLVAHTPHPYVVGTGFVHDHYPEGVKAKQCDVLVYDPRVAQPFYRLDEFVVIPPKCAKLAVEVKSCLGQEEFAATVSARRTFCKSLMGFAYEGPTFETFCRILAREIASRVGKDSPERMKLIPECIVIHRGNFIGFRATAWSPSSLNHCYLAVDFTKTDPAPEGLATALFMDMYMELIEKGELHDGRLHERFNQLPAAARVVILPDGVEVPSGKAGS